jgi:hypothetical protein
MIAKRTRKPRTRDRAEEAGVGSPAATPRAAQNNAEPPDGRDNKGRFAAGNPGGPGNPFARQTAQLRSALIQRVTSEDMGVIADALILKARNGNLDAIKLLFQYVIGKPAAAVNPDTLDVQEFRDIYAPRKEILEQGPQLMQGLPPHVLNLLVGTVNDVCAEQLGRVLSLPPEQLAQANLAEFFPGARPAPATVPSAPANQDHVSNPVVADINRLIYGDDEDDDDQEAEDELDQVDAAPSTNRPNGVNRPTKAGPRPSVNGGNGRAFKQGHQAAAPGAKGVASSPERSLKNGMGRGRRKEHGGPSTNGDAALDRRDGMTEAATCQDDAPDAGFSMPNRLLKSNETC